MTTSLYQKYRPQTWNDVSGQNHIKITLQNEIDHDKITHAYVFTGPRGVGKTTTARLLAKAINCQNRQPKGEPCNTCSACAAITAGSALDVIEIDAASHTGVDNVRENIIENARVAPTALPNKVFIIDEVHMLSASAFNALLKTLEEPPKNTFFILATTEIHKVPETIISRCQRFDFKRVSVPDLVRLLEKTATSEKIAIDNDVLEHIAKHADGCIRDAQSLLGQILSLGETRITMAVAELIIPRSNVQTLTALFTALLQKNAAAGLEIIHGLVEDGVNVAEFTKEFIAFLRGVMLLKVEGASQYAFFDMRPEEQEKIVQLSKEKNPGDIAVMMEMFVKRLQMIKQTDLQELPLELAVMEICFNTGADVVSQTGAQRSGQAGSGQVKTKNVVNQGTLSTAQVLQAGGVTPASAEAVKKTEVVKSSADLAAGELTKDAGAINMHDHWMKIVRAIKKHNHALHLTLKVAQLVSYKAGVLTLGFRYKFYKDRMNEEKNRQTVEQVVMEVTGEKVSIACEIHEKFSGTGGGKGADNLLPVTEGEVSNVWDLAVNTFGGEIVAEK